MTSNVNLTFIDISMNDAKNLIFCFDDMSQMGVSLFRLCEDRNMNVPIILLTKIYL